MKKLFPFYLVPFFFLLLTSCMKDNHSVRFRNDYSKDMYNIKIGIASIGAVKSKETSDYKPINPGEFEVSGDDRAGGTLSASGTITGRGTHKWTVTLDGAGTISIKKD